jgi:hypothetical protein
VEYSRSRNPEEGKASGDAINAVGEYSFIRYTAVHSGVLLSSFVLGKEYYYFT